MENVLKLKLLNRKLPPYIWKWFSKYKNYDEQTGSDTLIFENTYGQKFSKFDIFGNTLQDGTPTPENPILIQNVTGNNNIIVQNRNIFSSELENGWINNQGQNSTQTGLDSWRSKNYILIDSKTYYTLSRGRTNNLTNYIYFYDKNKQFINFVHVTNQEILTFESPINAKYMRWRLDSTDTIKPSFIQLELGLIASSYIEHKEQSVLISLGNIEMCKIDTFKDCIAGYTDHWKIVKKIKKTTLNFSDISFSNNIGFLGITDRALTTTENQFLYCDKLFFNGNYTSLQNAQNYMQDFQIAVNNNGTSKNIFIKNSTVNTKEAFLTWINGLNATIYYPLATPEEIVITDTTLINQLNQIQELRTYLDYTQISQENDELPFYLDIAVN